MDSNFLTVTTRHVIYRAYDYSNKIKGSSGKENFKYCNNDSVVVYIDTAMDVSSNP